MNILFLSNFYPPLAHGGYEQWCQEVAQGLRNQGHDIIVLTSRYRKAEIIEPEATWIYRDLHLEMDFTPLSNSFGFFINRKAREKENMARLCQIVNEFDSEIILVWGMWNIPRSLLALAEKIMPGRVVYYIADYWPTLPTQHEFYWESPAHHWGAAIPKRILRIVAGRILAYETKPTLQFNYTIFPSVFMCSELIHKGLSPQYTKIIYGAIDTSLYQYHFCNDSLAQNGRRQNVLTLLYAGRLTAEKGVHTAIEALSILVHQYGFNNLRLNVVGTGSSDYVAQLHKLVVKEDLTSFVTFLGTQPKETMPKIYSQADVFLFTSIWQEPFGRVLVEAMASGVVVVGTATGGAVEILVDNENALIFLPNDAVGLASQIIRLIENPLLQKRLAENGRKTSLERFDISRMVKEIDIYLEGIVDKQ